MRREHARSFNRLHHGIDPRNFRDHDQLESRESSATFATSTGVTGKKEELRFMGSHVMLRAMTIGHGTSRGTHERHARQYESGDAWDTTLGTVRALGAVRAPPRSGAAPTDAWRGTTAAAQCVARVRLSRAAAERQEDGEAHGALARRTGQGGRARPQPFFFFV